MGGHLPPGSLPTPRSRAGLAAAPRSASRARGGLAALTGAVTGNVFYNFSNFI